MKFIIFEEKNMKNLFSLGEIVTFKTHPLLYGFRIKGDGKFVPPIMIVKEVFFENNKKKIFDEITGKKIAELIKYTCIYFDDNKSEFKDVVVYETMLKSFKDLFIGRIDKTKNTPETDEYISLRTEVSNYVNAKYKYGNIVYFKTKKLEIFKKRSSKKIVSEFDKKKNIKITEEKEITQYVVNYSTPEFIICGYKKENSENLYYSNGNKRRIVSNEFFKVKWFNPHLMKFSEQFLPVDCFIDKQPFKTKKPHNLIKKKTDEEE